MQRASCCKKRRQNAEWTKLIRPRPIVPLPAIVAGERDMLPSQRCNMPGYLVRRTDFGQYPSKIAGVPQDDRSDQQVEAGGAVGLVLEPAVAQLA